MHLGFFWHFILHSRYSRARRALLSSIIPLTAPSWLRQCEGWSNTTRIHMIHSTFMNFMGCWLVFKLWNSKIGRIPQHSARARLQSWTKRCGASCGTSEMTQVAETLNPPRQENISGHFLGLKCLVMFTKDFRQKPPVGNKKLMTVTRSPTAARPRHLTPFLVIRWISSCACPTNFLSGHSYPNHNDCGKLYHDT